MNDKLLELKEKCENGNFDDNELIDLVLHLDRENQILLEENRKLVEIQKEKIMDNEVERTIKF